MQAPVHFSIINGVRTPFSKGFFFFELAKLAPPNVDSPTGAHPYHPIVIGRCQIEFPGNPQPVAAHPNARLPTPTGHTCCLAGVNGHPPRGRSQFWRRSDIKEAEPAGSFVSPDPCTSAGLLSTSLNSSIVDGEEAALTPAMAKDAPESYSPAKVPCIHSHQPAPSLPP